MPNAPSLGYEQTKDEVERTDSRVSHLVTRLLSGKAGGTDLSDDKVLSDMKEIFLHKSPRTWKAFENQVVSVPGAKESERE
jgi:hypothetical protein